jgi:hypothetical protein
LLAVCPLLQAQEIEPNISLDLNLIPFESRVDIQNLRQDLLSYLSTQRFTNQEWKLPKVPVDIGITITSRRGMNTYTGILTIMSYTILEKGGKSVVMRALDKNWTFEYSPGTTLTYQSNRFNTFSSPIDFYVMTAIGLFLDTYTELDGTDMFEQAKIICRLGANAGVSGYTLTPDPATPSKIALATELTDLQFEQFRKLFFAYHADGLEAYSQSKEKGQKALATVIAQLAAFKKEKVTMRSMLMDSFFNAKFQELADIFKGYQDPRVFADLIALDPSNSTIYQQAQDGR